MKTAQTLTNHDGGMQLLLGEDMQLRFAYAGGKEEQEREQ